MDVIFMAQISSLLTKIKHDYPQLTFEKAENFSWNYDTATLTYAPQGDPAYLLHELSHAVLGHRDYLRDIGLLAHERDAWEHARNHLADKYDIPVPEDAAEDALDTYRDWLHARSACPTCSATGVQTKSTTYTCPACMTHWRVNEAKTCALRRYKL